LREHAPARPESRWAARTGIPPPGYVLSGCLTGPGSILGMIRESAAIYNGQYAKGLVHAVIWGILMSSANSRAAHGLEPVFVMLVLGLVGLHGVRSLSTALKRREANRGDEYSSLVDLRGRPNQVRWQGRAHHPGVFCCCCIPRPVGFRVRSALLAGCC